MMNHNDDKLNNVILWYPIFRQTQKARSKLSSGHTQNPTCQQNSTRIHANTSTAICCLIVAQGSKMRASEEVFIQLARGSTTWKPNFWSNLRSFWDQNSPCLVTTTRRGSADAACACGRIFFAVWCRTASRSAVVPMTWVSTLVGWSAKFCGNQVQCVCVCVYIYICIYIYSHQYIVRCSKYNKDQIYPTPSGIISKLSAQRQVKLKETSSRIEQNLTNSATNCWETAETRAGTSHWRIGRPDSGPGLWGEFRKRHLEAKLRWKMVKNAEKCWKYAEHTVNISANWILCGLISGMWM